MPEPKPGSIADRCEDPRQTRALAPFQPVPCYRCLAYRPESKSGCHFIEVSHLPRGEIFFRSTDKQEEIPWES